jgi:hypothetical protein
MDETHHALSFFPQNAAYRPKRRAVELGKYNVIMKACETGKNSRRSSRLCSHIQ